MKNNIIYITKDKGVDEKMCDLLSRLKNNTAEQLLEKYNIPLTPPIDILLLLEKIGIALIRNDFIEIENSGNIEHGTISGAAISKDETLAIFYRDSDTYNRQRFTIAHELAHCCIHADDLEINHIELRDNFNSNNPKEIEANIFAGKLLIPLSALKDVYNQLVVPPLSTLAEIFEVSTNVMAARLDYLNMPYLKDIKISEN